MLELALLGAVIGSPLALAKYNELVKLRNKAVASFGDVDAALTRRFDLVPSLVATVRGYAQHEHDTLESVIKMRRQVADTSGIEDRIKAENALTATLSRLFALQEKYPDLQASANFLSLQETLTKIEDDLQKARQRYNKVACVYNNACETFPALIVAKSMGFKKMPYFGASDKARQGFFHSGN